MLTKNEIEKLLEGIPQGVWSVHLSEKDINKYNILADRGNDVPLIIAETFEGYCENREAERKLLAHAPDLARLCLELMDKNETLDQDTYKAVRALEKIVNEHHVTPDIVSFATLNLEALEQQRHVDYINSLLKRIERLKIQLDAAKTDRAISESSVY